MHKAKMILVIILCNFALPLFAADTQQQPASTTTQLALIRQFDHFATMALSPKGDKLALASRKKLDLWQTNSDDKDPLLSMQDNCDGSISAVGFHPNGQTCATGSMEGCLCVYDAQSGEQLNHITIGKGLINMIHAFALHPSKDECIISKGNIIEVWDLAQRHKLREICLHQHPITQLAYAPHSMHVTAVRTHGVVNLLKADLEHATQPISANLDYACWTNGQYVAQGFEDGSITLYEPEEDSFGYLKRLFTVTEQQLGSTHLEYEREKFSLTEKGNAAVDAGEYTINTYATRISSVGIGQNHLLIGLQDGEIIELNWEETDGDISIATRQLRAPIPLSEQPDPREGRGPDGCSLTPIGKETKEIVASADDSCFASLSRDLTMHRLFNGQSTPKDAYKIHVWKAQPADSEPNWRSATSLQEEAAEQEAIETMKKLERQALADKANSKAAMIDAVQEQGEIAPSQLELSASEGSDSEDEDDFKSMGYGVWPCWPF